MFSCRIYNKEMQMNIKRRTKVGIISMVTVCAWAETETVGG